MDTYKFSNSDSSTKQSERYERIEALNVESFMLAEGSSLRVIQSLHSVGAPRDVLSDKNVEKFHHQTVEYAQKISRVALAGNMSPLHGYGPSDLTPEQRIEDAKENVANFLYLNDINPEQVRILRPERDYETPLSVVNLDDSSFERDDTGLLRPEQAADLLYTYDSEIVMAARPADCPIVFVSAETPKGGITVLLHLAWLGVAHGYVHQAKKELDELGVDWASAQVQITSGGHADTYAYKDFEKFNPVEKYPIAASMFVDLQESKNEEGKTAYTFGIDVAAEVYEQVSATWGVDPHNLFADTTNTTAPESGYSSHSRSSKGYEVDGDNTRDLVLAARERFPKQNPNKEAPVEVLQEIKSVRVRYYDFNGELQVGTVEIHKDLADDVKQFFEKAAELHFPIERVVKSSDEKYAWDDDALMADNATTGYNYRLIKGTDKPSLHGLGRALDINDALNPYVRYVDGQAITDPPGATYDPTVPGTLTAEHPLVIFMKNRGWEWGGDWTPESGRTDYQHFQKAPK
jgi:peptidoglycan L-alanyl-D-glutamate endopeptidase CwlK